MMISRKKHARARNIPTGSLLLSGAMAFNVSAQTCFEPLPLLDNMVQPGDTCAATNVLPVLGGVFPSPQKDIVYRIPPGQGPVTFSFQGGDASLNALVLPACNSNASILAYAEIPPSASGTISLSSIPSGGGYLVVTGDIASTPESCGSYQLVVTGNSLPSGTCQNPAPVPTSQPLTANTCMASALNLNMGGVYLPHRGVVHHFSPDNIPDRFLHLHASDFDLEVLVSTSCTAVPLLAMGVPAGTTGELDISSLSSGNYLLVVTSSPSDHRGQCGTYSVRDRPPGVFVDEAAFLSEVARDHYLESFDGVPPDGPHPSLGFSQGVFAYMISTQGAPTIGLWNGTGFVSTTSYQETLRIDFTGAPVYAFGGRIWATDTVFSPLPITTVVGLDDGRTFRFRTGGAEAFRGFVSDTPIDHVLISSETGSNAYPTIDNIIVGQ